MPSVAIVGMACRYPDARSPVELWENVLAQRRAFRRLPPERLRLEDYLSLDHNAADCTYSTEAALIEGYEFDRTRFRVAGSTYRTADLAHWLALDVAAQALNDAGFPDGADLPRDTTGVLLGNTLTGEFSRAGVMRLRWPYVRRVVEAGLIEEGRSVEQRRAFLETLEAQFKAPFPPIAEETLAGGLSNTIAGRICNHFDLKGGGYTVDGACAASLLAVTTACSALVAGDLDVAVAGGVDLSLDPFELVGFAKLGALAAEDMRVYDVRSAGFWPGEGCGFVVLMRYQDALAQHRRVYAVIRGWGVSSDGSGGITRPEVDGQLLALRRAYRRAELGIETVGYFEGHGTGTAVGDAVELRVLSSAREEAPPGAPPAVIGSIKANIGHTKAAAGVAGLIKATMAVHTQILPPTTGCEEPLPELTARTAPLRILRAGELWPSDRRLRAGVSAMGFGGINTHVVVEGVAPERRTRLSSIEQTLLSSVQDAELILISAESADDLQRRTERLLTFAGRLSRAEVADLAVQLEHTLRDRPARAAIVASSAAELMSRLETLRSWLTEGATARLDVRAGVFLGTGADVPRIGFLFPGQGSPVHLHGGALRRRFQCVEPLYGRMNILAGEDVVATAVAQPAIVTASLAALRVLDQLALTASVAIGHSLGELTALHWAGAFDEETVLRIAIARGRVMAELATPTGAMASIGARREEVERLLDSDPVVIAGLNSPRQTVVSGETNTVARIITRATAKGLTAVNLRVSHAFHSPLVAAATPALAAHLSEEKFSPLQRTVVSTVTGGPLSQDEDLPALLSRQVTAPVRFEEAIRAAGHVDLFIEVGPGQVLTGLAGDIVNTAAVALDAAGPSLKGLLRAVGAAFALGAPVKRDVLLRNRFSRPFDLNWRPRFFMNPCELAPTLDGSGATRVPASMVAASMQPAGSDTTSAATIDAAQASVTEALSLVRQLVAERAELPVAAVKDDSRLLDDLHLNSITVGELIGRAARSLGVPRPLALTDYANATPAEVARALQDLARADSRASLEEAERSPPGVAAWVRAYTVELVERPMPRHHASSDPGEWQVLAAPDHPLADPLRRALVKSAHGSGVAVCLPPEPDERHVDLLLDGARAILASSRPSKFALVQHGGGAAGFARTLHFEAPHATTCVIDVPWDHPQAVEWIVAEAMAEMGYVEAHYDMNGRRREPVLRLLPTDASASDLPLGASDVLLVTGGGKGIAAECALVLARETGARLALLGRSQPATDPVLAQNLDRMAAAGLHVQYIAADVTDADAVRRGIDEVRATLGPVTAILHGAGTNVPESLRSLSRSTFLQILAPKVQGARNLLASVDVTHLRLFIAFSSMIARTGMHGEAHYAVANEWLTRLTARLQAQCPACRCLSVEWSVWSGLGMGEQLGRVDALMRQGISPIAPDAGTFILRRLLSQRLPSPAVAVTGRLGSVPTLKVEQPELPLGRFLEHPVVYYPGVELVAESYLSVDTDPYLNDHVFSGQRLFPAVMGLEAMAQVAMAVSGASHPPLFEQVRFDRPVVVPNDGPLRIRLAALVRAPSDVEVVLRSEETAFQVDHFRAICRFGKILELPICEDGEDGASVGGVQELPPLPLVPDRDLYGRLLFQRGRFKRLRAYRQLRATKCLAEIESNVTADWFGPYLPSTLVLGDPGTRDAAIHAIQSCVPDAPLLPIRIDRLLIDAAAPPASVFVDARERSSDSNTFTYDLEVKASDGSVREQWEGLHLRVVAGATPQGPWVEPLLGPYIERRIQELCAGSNVAVVVERDSALGRRARSNRAIQRAVGTQVPIHRRPDGKPEVEGRSVSAAHAGDLTLAVAGEDALACDLESVVPRSTEVWRELLGVERFGLAQLIARETGEDQDTAATRVWAAGECLKKAGAMIASPLVVGASTSHDCVPLRAEPFVISTFAVIVGSTPRRLVVAVSIRRRDAGL